MSSSNNALLELSFMVSEIARLQDRVSKQFFRETGLNQSQLFALTHLARVEEISQTDLAHHLGIRKAATGTLVEGLEAKGLVERARSRTDRRLQLVSITETGRDVVVEINRIAAAASKQYRRGISSDERVTLVSILQRLRENLREMSKSAEG